MMYAQARLKHILHAFRQASFCDTEDRLFMVRQAYDFRHDIDSDIDIDIAPFKPQANIYRSIQEFDDDDDYDPLASNRKRKSLISVGPQTFKRQRASTLETIDASGIVKNSDPTSPLCSASAATWIAPFITLVLKTKTFELQRLANEHGTGYKARESPFTHPMDETYLSRLDQESSQIDNAKNRCLRNGRKVPEFQDPIQRCVACVNDRVRCVGREVEGDICEHCKKQTLECLNSPAASSEGVDEVKLQPGTDVEVPETGGALGTQANPIFLESLSAVRSPTLSPGFLPGTQANPILLEEWPLPRPSVILLESSPEPEPEPSKQVGPEGTGAGKVFSIKTHWAHPINFKFVAAKNEGQICHFCADSKYGMFGYGMSETEVIKYPKKPYEETGNGHRARGREATRMCVFCALDRLYISRCTKHVMKAPRIYQTANGVAIDGDLPPKKLVHPTCSMCVSPATFRCFADQKADMFRRPLAEGAGTGCGLLLCEVCTTNMGTQGRLVRPPRSESNNTNGGSLYRADLEFLFLGSLLHESYGMFSSPQRYSLHANKSDSRLVNQLASLAVDN